jgi:ribonuclease P/MRP protein subunit POP1
VADEEEAMNAAPSSSTPPVWLVRDPLLPLLPHILSSPNPAETLAEMISAFRHQRGFQPCSLSPTQLYEAAVLHVRVEMHGRGSPGDMAQIYSLSANDVGRWLAAQEESEQVGRVWVADEGMSSVQAVRFWSLSSVFGWGRHRACRGS